MSDPKYLHIVVDTPDEYFIAVFTGFVDDIPVFKRVEAKSGSNPTGLFIFDHQLKDAADCAQQLNKLFPAMTAVTQKSRKKKKGE